MTWLDMTPKWRSGCTCPRVWHGVIPPHCPVHNPLLAPTPPYPYKPVTIGSGTANNPMPPESPPKFTNKNRANDDIRRAGANNMKPSIGRILHYVSRGSADGVYPPVHVPLIVVKVDEIDDSDGAVFFPLDDDLDGGRAIALKYVVSGWTLNSHGQRYEEDVPFLGEFDYPATCHWPEREE